MTDKKPPKTPQNPQFTADLLALIDRHQLSEPAAAALLGVPVFTLKKWTTGERSPSAATIRLLEVLGIVEALAPSLFGVLTPQNGHVEKSSSKRSTAS
jgi:DNA-binding transcriptional regulator YiaG